MAIGMERYNILMTIWRPLLYRILSPVFDFSTGWTSVDAILPVYVVTTASDLWHTEPTEGRWKQPPMWRRASSDSVAAGWAGVLRADHDAQRRKTEDCKRLRNRQSTKKIAGSRSASSTTLRLFCLAVELLRRRRLWMSPARCLRLGYWSEGEELDRQRWSTESQICHGHSLQHYTTIWLKRVA